MAEKSKLSFVEGTPGIKEEEVLAIWHLNNKDRHAIAWKSTKIVDIFHVIIEHISLRLYLDLSNPS